MNLSVRPAWKPFAHLSACILGQFALVITITLFKHDFYNSILFDSINACGLGLGALIVSRSRGMTFFTFKPCWSYCVFALTLGVLAGFLDLQVWTPGRSCPPVSNFAILKAMVTSHAWLKVGLLIVPVCLLYPLFEEIVFRGIFLDGLRERFLSAWPPLLISSGVFASLHMTSTTGLRPILDLFALALALAWLTLRTRSLLPAFLLHAAYNSTELLVVSCRQL